MPRGSKRKHGSDEEPSGTMAPQASNQRTAIECPIPQPDTQELYNKMRQEEERLTPESLGQMHNGPSNLLQPPSPSQATPSSPSPSYASTTHSIGQAMDDMRVGDHLRVRKQGRHGPLSEPKKRRAALMRKLRACNVCRGRKVQCSHLDLRLFEAAYQASKQVAIQPVNLPSQPVHNTPYHSRLGNPLDFAGIGVAQNPISRPPPLLRDGFQNGGDEAHVDYDPLEQTRHQQPPVAPHVTSILGVFGDSGPPTFNTNDQYLHARALQNNQEPTDIPIGKQVLPYCQMWTCLWSTCATSTGGPATCDQKFSHLELLKMHLMVFHELAFDNTWEFCLCINCGHSVLPPLLPEATSPCLRCGASQRGDTLGLGAPTWQRWCMTRVPARTKHSSLPVVRVSSQEGSPSNHSAWTSHSAPHPGSSGGQHNPYMPSAGGYGWGNGTGPYSYNAAGAPTPSKSEKPDFCCEKPDPVVCCSDSDMLVADMWPLSRLFSNNKGSTKISFLRHACPAAVVLAVFVYTLINTWVATGHLGGGGLEPVFSRLVSFIVPDGRIRIPELSLACIAAGLVISWLYRHVRLQYERRDQRGVFDHFPLKEERVGQVGVVFPAAAAATIAVA